MLHSKVARLALSAATFAIDKPYDYLLTDQLAEKAAPGMRVTVPFGRGNRRCEGVILSISDESSYEKLKCVESLLDETPALSGEQIKLALWMRDRFFCTVYDAMRVMLPTGMWFKDGARRIKDKTMQVVSLAIPAEDAVIFAEQKKMRAPMQTAVLNLLTSIGSAPVKEICYFTGASKNSITALQKAGIIELSHVEVFRRPEIAVTVSTDPIVLNSEQETAFDSLSGLLNSDASSVSLLYGITGSGKTSVYIKLISEVISAGKSAIILVPEIALTPQLLNTFSAHFGDEVAVLHSSLGVGERYDEWKRIRSGTAHVVIGTRSAVFAPVSNLGLIIIDEEQETTYKSENNPRYHARDVAKYRCFHSGALLLLGSATPSVDSMYNANLGKYKLFRLGTRYNKGELPPVIVADMRKELQNGNGSTISSILERELRQNIENGEQSILFINRRGANTLVSCGECGHNNVCPRCSVSMTFHSANRRLMCHYCGHSQSVPETCPECGGSLKFMGAGTQKAEAELKALFPMVDIVRMDTDTVSPLKSHEILLSQFQKKRVPILLGTQMVAKGLDFENVTLVGVLSADQALYMDNYRAHERAFSMLTQVIGRSGRGSKPGRAVIQTFTPHNEVIMLASEQDYDAFYSREIELRRTLNIPPVNDLFVITTTGLNEISVLKACAKIRDALFGYLSDVPNISILGPAPAGITKVNDRFRYRVSLCCENTKRIRDTISHIIKEFSKNKESRGISIFADIDPLN